MEQNNNNEQSINLFLKDFYTKNYIENKLLFDNMQNIYTLISFLYNNMQELDIEEQNLREGQRTNIIETEKIIDDFYKSIGIDFKFNDIIKNGTFNIIKTNYPKESSYHELLCGNNHYINIITKEKEIITHKTINCYNNTLITDSIVWVHEISHYRNQPERSREEVNDMLTELLAFTEEFIYIDYLEQIGYEKEARMFKIEEYQNLHNFINNGYHVVRIYLLYFLLGEVSKENYQLLYKEDKNYKNSLDAFEDFQKKNNTSIFTVLFYALGIISIYNYEEYKKNSNFLEKIEKLNTKIMEDNISLENALKIIDIELTQESLSKILESINIFREELIKEKVKTKQKTNN